MRDVICQLPPESKLPSYMGARLKKPAYGMNDAPRRWWNRIDGSLQKYGMIPTRADRCTYVLYSKMTTHQAKSEERTSSSSKSEDRTSSSSQKHDSPERAKGKKFTSQPKMPGLGSEFDLDNVLEYILDPVTGSPANQMRVHGIVCLHVDDLFMVGDDYFNKAIVQKVKTDYKIGSEDLDDVMFTGQRARWVNNRIQVDQNKAVEELTETEIPKGLKDSELCSPSLHTQYRSILGSINWLQSRTQFHAPYDFSRAASVAAKPTVHDVREINKLVRKIRSMCVMLVFHRLKGPTRILGYPDASYRNNSDMTSQRGQTIFIAEERVSKFRKNQGTAGIPQGSSRGSLVDYESTKIRRTTLSTTVAELYGLMKCFGTCQFLRGLWMDISGEKSPIHIRTDANNLVSTASTAHLPEQKEIIHMIQMLRKEACSGNIADLGHVRTQFCLADCLTKSSAKPDNLINAVDTGILPQVDVHPPFRDLMQHKAYMSWWVAEYLEPQDGPIRLLMEDVGEAGPRPQTYWCMQQQSFVVSVPKHRDHWLLEGRVLQRIHVRPRKTMFDPSKSRDLPVDIARVHAVRTTNAHGVSGSRMSVQDRWGRVFSQQPLAELWTGSTVFAIQN